MEVYENKSIQSAKKLIYIYMFSFPIRMISVLNGVCGIFKGLANTSSFLFFMIGMIMIIKNTGGIPLPSGSGNPLYHKFLRMWIVCDVSSIIMALLLYSSLGKIGGESTFDAILPKIMCSLAFIAFTIFNAYTFQIINKEEIASVIEKMILFCIILGLLQIAVMYIGGPFTSINNIISGIFRSWSSSQIRQTQRIGLLTSEPARIAGFLSIFLIPFIFSKMIEEGISFSRTMKLIMLVVILYFTKSTTGYALFSVGFVVFTVMYLKERKTSTAIKFVFLLFAICSVGIIVMCIMLENGTSQTIYYVLVDKLFNIENTNTVSRKIPLYINANIFKEYPILGVGNGTQGFFYKEFFPDWGFISNGGKRNYDMAGDVLFDGASFLPAFLSGYGIVGVILLFLFAVGSVKIVRNNRANLGYISYFYKISGIAIIIYGFTTTFVGELWVWYIISLPFAAACWSNENDRQQNACQRI